MHRNLVDRYYKLFGAPETHRLTTVRAPGRVNLLGAHTDYSGGLVLPAAVNLTLYLVGAMRDDTRALVHSVAYNETVEFSVLEFERSGDHSWVNYVKGVMHEFKRRMPVFPGFQAVLGGDLPVGAGLGSSAALEVAVGAFLAEITDTRIDLVEIARIGMKAENEYVGMRCGIMDQMASALGRHDSLLFIDCGMLEYRYVPWDTGRASIVLADTKRRRGLVDSGFNDRRNLVLQAMERFREIVPTVSYSSEISGELFQRHRDRLPEAARPLLEHVICENARVAKGAKALENGDYESFGRLMSKSFDGSRTLFRVTTAELDFIADIARRHDGAYGAKLMGGGFGGAVAVLTRPDGERDFIERLIGAYHERFGEAPGITVCRPAMGVSVTIG